MILKGLSSLFGLIVDARNAMYDNAWLSSEGVTCPVISIGNMTVGGTGKTPVARHLVQWSLESGLRPAFVSRGYKGKTKGPARVTVTPESSNLFGDEPVMVAKSLPNVPVYIGANRVDTIRHLLKNESIDLVFADDAFQHRKLKRDIDIVVVDVLEARRNYNLLPQGRAREPLKNISRADFIIFNKCNLIEEGAAKTLVDIFSPYVSAEFVRDRFIRCEYHVSRLDPIGSQHAPVTSQKVSLMSGIGRPEGFERLVRSSGLDVVSHRVFADHHFFEKEDIDKVIEDCRRHQADRIIVTEKDAVKVLQFADQLKNFYVLNLDVRFDSNMQHLYSAISNLTKKNVSR